MKHFTSYEMIEGYFAEQFPTMSKYTKAIHRISFKPKKGIILIELKNGCGIHFMAESFRENNVTTYRYIGTLLSVDDTKDLIDDLNAKKAKASQK